MNMTAERRNSQIPTKRERRNIRQRRKRSVLSFLSGKIVYVAIVAGAIYVIGNFFSQQPYIKAKETEISKVQKQIEEQQRENLRLLEEQSEMGTRAGKEKIAREKLGYVKKGEKVFIDVEGE